MTGREAGAEGRVGDGGREDQRMGSDVRGGMVISAIRGILAAGA